jgi:PIN domain nuclease of toxin-antitoxin system
MPTADAPRVWVLDTHIWIRLLAKDAELSGPAFLQALAEVQKSQGLRLAGISLWETAMLVNKGRLKLEKPVLEWMRAALTLPGLELVALSPDIASDSSFLPGEFHGDPADRQIVATARHLGAQLVTFDAAILAYGAQGWVSVVDPRSLG